VNCIRTSALLKKYFIGINLRVSGTWIILINRSLFGANIYFVENQSITIIYAEMPAVKEYDVLVFGETEHINRRYYPNDHRVETIPIEDRFRIQGLLVDWLANKGMRHDIRVGK
jgi:hypothetical protein